MSYVQTPAGMLMLAPEIMKTKGLQRGQRIETQEEAMNLMAANMMFMIADIATDDAPSADFELGGE